MAVMIHASGRTQRLSEADLTKNGKDVFSSMVPPDGCDIVYSDPPWSPGNEKWWRRHAGLEPPEAYQNLLAGWCACVIACHPTDVFCEQSVVDEHRNLLLGMIDSCPGWGLPLVEQWTVFYGSPLRPNVLLHFGKDKLRTNPEGMHGEAMTRRVFESFAGRVRTVADPCTGLGMTSRMAHEFGADFVGTELNSKRLDRTIGWLLRHGYRRSE